MQGRQNNFPATHVSVSGGYNVSSQEKADEEALLKLFQDRVKGRTNQSVVLPRSATLGLDDYKFSYSLLPGVPMSLFGIRNAMIDGVKSNVLGNEDVYHTADSLNQTKSQSLDEIIFVPERYQGSRIDHNWLDLFASHNLAEGEIGLITCLDTPLAFNLFPKLLDGDNKNYDVIIDFNTKKAVDGLFDRNFYDYLIDEKEVRAWKEPNVYSFTKKGLDAAAVVVPHFYNNRRGGAQLNVVFRVIVPQTIKHPLEILNVAKVARYLFNKKPETAISSDEASEFGSAMLSDLFGNIKVRIKGRHKDPFQVRDIDGLHDFAFYRAIMEEVAYKDGNGFDIRNLSSIYPYADHLANAAEHLASKNLPIIVDFDDFINSKVERLNSKLNDFGKRYSVDIAKLRKKKHNSSISDKNWYNAVKEMESYKIPTPLINGRINMQLINPDVSVAKEQIRKTIDYLMQSHKTKLGKKDFPGYLAKYAIDKAKFYSALKN